MNGSVTNECSVEEFVALVKLVRQTQKDYFKTRSQTMLQHSKLLEKKLDLLVAKALVEHEQGAQTGITY